MYQDFLLSEVESFKKYLLRGTPAKATAAEQSASDIAAAASEAMARAEAQMAASAAAQAASVAIQAASSAAETTSEAAPVAAAPASSVTSSPVSSAPKSLDKSDKSEKSDKTKPKVSTSASDQEWVSQLPENGYVLQLAAFDTADEIQAFKRSQSAYGQTRIMSPLKKGSDKRYFILVAGPFPGKAQAEAFMATDPLFNKGWLRSSKSLKAQFERP